MHRGVAFIVGALVACAYGCSVGHRQHSIDERVVANADDVAPLGLEAYRAAEPDLPGVAGKVAIGRRLFFDTILAADNRMRCASCHRPDRAFTDGQAKSIGAFGRVGMRGVPSILNAGYGRRFLWDGRDSVLEQQVLAPIVNPNELGIQMGDVLARLNASATYQQEFARLFEDGVTARNLGRALASYVRTLRAGNAPFDRYAAGDTTAMSADARRGYALFVGRANCAQCHAGPLLTDEEFHNSGVGWGAADVGRALVTGLATDRGKFNTPSLRNVARTAPYMHDGSIATLEEVVAFYDRGAGVNPNLDSILQPVRLTARERADLVAFLVALSSPE
jgi:cytochrome c peroxidase